MSEEHLKSYKVYLGGKWIATGEEIPVTNPATGEPFARVSALSREHIRSALEAAQASFPAWRGLRPRNAAHCCTAWPTRCISAPMRLPASSRSKTASRWRRAKARVAMTEDHLRWFAEEGRRAYGRVIPHQVLGKRNLAVKTPIGVVGAIAPWNFPLVLAVRKAAPALAAGCPVILKPSSQTPLCAIAFAECVEAAGVPGGVFQLVVGNARMISEEFLANPICRKVTFTGSTEVGRELIRAAAPSIKPLSLELGGLAPLLIFADCDLEQAVKETLVAKFRNTGQSCIAANRIYVQRSIHDAFLDRFVAGVEKLKTADGLEPGVDVGPLINQQALDSALGQIEDAVRHGGKLICGGKRLAGTSGYFLEPTVIDGAGNAALCMREETFAPVAPISTFETEEEAIELANGSDYGLSAYAMTRDVARVFRLAERIEAGTLGINDGAPTTSQSPFGGVKQSGWGRELGNEGLEAFLETKHVSIGGI